MTVQAFGMLTRLWMWAALLRVLKHGVALPRLVKLARVSPRRGVRREEAFEGTLAKYLERRDRFPFRAPGNCLERSLGAYRLLCARGARPQLVVGVSLEQPERLRGHVWLEVDGRPFGERAGDLEGFTTVVRFDESGNPRAAPGFSGAVSDIHLAS